MVGCAIWGTAARDLESQRNGAEFDSVRAGGRYFIASSAVASMDQLDESQKSRLTTWLIDQRLQGIETPEISTYVLDIIRTSRALSPATRADRLLQYLARESVHLGEEVSYGGGAGAYLEMLAWSESLSRGEFAFLKGILESKGYIEDRAFSGGGHITVLVDGYEHLEATRSNYSLFTQGFVAMWFDDGMSTAYLEGIAPAIGDAGYAPMRIDFKQHNNKIDDEIVAEIRRSRFLVADFTHGAQGPRGGVYYEAGLAHGLSIPVIFTVRADMIGNTHFDTRQYSHILWSEPRELRKQLADRISATIGDGPLRT